MPTGPGVELQCSGLQFITDYLQIAYLPYRYAGARCSDNLAVIRNINCYLVGNV